MFVALATVRDTLTTLTTTRAVEHLSGDEAISAARELGAIRRLVDTLAADAVARIHATNAHHGRGDRSATETVAKALRITNAAAADLYAAATATTIPEIDHAARAGNLDTRATALIGATAHHAPDRVTELIAAAQGPPRALREACLRARADHEDPEARARRQHAARELRLDTDDDGMIRGRFRLTPEIGGKVKALIDAGVQQRFRARRGGTHEPHHAYAADTLTELVLSHAHATDTDGADRPAADRGRDATPTTPSRVTATVHVLIDHAALVRGHPLPGETCEIPGVGPVNAQWVRDLLGEAFLTAIIRRGTDILTVTHLGRHVNATLRTALLAQGRECDIDTCPTRGYLEIDHAHDHARGGPTALHNLGWLCAHHHRLKTAGWQLGPRHPTTHKRTLTPPARAPDHPHAA